MEKFKYFIFICLLIFVSSFMFIGNAVCQQAGGTIERSVKQQILAALLPSPSGSSEILFLTSPLKKYSAFLIRTEATIGAGGFGIDFCYIQVQEEDGSIVWQSECASTSTVNTCTLLFSDMGLEIYDGSRSSWSSEANGDRFQRLDLLDEGDMEIRDQNGELVWQASDEPNVNQNCGSLGAPGLLASTLPPFAKPISQGNSPLGQGVSQPFSNPANQQPFAGNNNNPQQGPVDNISLSGCITREISYNAGLILVPLLCMITLFA